MKLKVKWARLVICETVIDVEDGKVGDTTLIEGKLPSVFEGIPTEMIPDHIQDVADYDQIWEVEEKKERIDG